MGHWSNTLVNERGAIALVFGRCRVPPCGQKRWSDWMSCGFEMNRKITVSSEPRNCFLLSHRLGPEKHNKCIHLTFHPGKKIRKGCHDYIMFLSQCVVSDEHSIVCPRISNTLWVGVWTPKHLLRRLLGVPSIYSPGIWRILDTVEYSSLKNHIAMTSARRRNLAEPVGPLQWWNSNGKVRVRGCYYC